MKLIKNIIFITFFVGSMVAYSNSIVIGVPGFAPPFSFLGSHKEFYGFAIDLVSEICKRLNETCEYKAVTSVQQIDALNSGDIDLALPSSPIPQEEQYKYMYSVPYMTSNGEFVTLNPNIKSIEDLKDKKIGILAPSHLRNVLLPFAKKENIKEYNRLPGLLSAIQNNEVDALLINVSINKYFVNNQIINLRVIGNPISLGNGYGIMALPKNALLIQNINKALLQIESDGTYKTIYAKYFGI